MEKAFRVEDGALVEAPVFEGHRRGRNWLAVISPDPRSPAGLARAFCTRGHGRYLYLVDSLRPGQAVEFGADYYSSSGRKHPNRWYGVVKEVRTDAVIFEEAESPEEALRKASEAAGTAPAFADLSGVPTEVLLDELRRRGALTA